MAAPRSLAPRPETPRPARRAMARGIVALLALLWGTVAAGQPRVLLVTLDDCGVDLIGAYGEHPDPAHTPVIDQLAAEGVLFRNAWSQPLCSPTRATIMTGRYPFRTGVGTFLSLYGSDELSLDGPLLPRMLPPAFRTAAVGKWHLSGAAGAGPQHPLLAGFGFHRGTMSNLQPGETYDAWEKNVDGVLGPSTTYMTTDAVDEALGLIASFGSEPWFLWLSFNAPHEPFHAPPAALHSQSLPSDPATEPALAVRAMTEALDTELGRLLDGMDPVVRAQTVVIVVGDNGTSPFATTSPFSTQFAKGSLNEGGINVPLIVSGPGVVQGEACDALVDTTDLYATVIELAGGAAPAADGVSVVPYLSDPGRAPLREWVFAERFVPLFTPLLTSRVRAARDARHKLIRYENADGPFAERLFDLVADPYETTDLLAGAPTPEQADARDALAAVFDQLTDAPCALPICSVGGGVAGTAGVPWLWAAGDLLPDAPMTLSLTGARPDAPVVLVLGFGWINLPFKGGLLVPAPDVLFAGFVTDALGELHLASAWPPTDPGDVYLQAWIVDPAAPAGLSASTALQLSAP